MIRDNVLQMEGGDARTIYYTVIPAAASSEVNWNSDNSEVASVNEKGEVSAIVTKGRSTERDKGQRKTTDRMKKWHEKGEKNESVKYECK